LNHPPLTPPLKRGAIKESAPLKGGEINEGGSIQSRKGKLWMVSTEKSKNRLFTPGAFGEGFLIWLDLCYFSAFFHSFSKGGNLASREVSYVFLIVSIVLYLFLINLSVLHTFVLYRSYIRHICPFEMFRCHIFCIL